MIPAAAALAIRPLQFSSLSSERASYAFGLINNYTYFLLYMLIHSLRLSRGRRSLGPLHEDDSVSKLRAFDN